MELHQIVFDVLWAVACGYALVRGGPPERIIAAAFVVASPLTKLVEGTVVLVYQSVEGGILLVDFVLLGVLLAIALVSARYWPMLMTSMQGSEVLGHLAKLMAPEILPRAYYAVVVFWSFPMLGLLALGTWRHRRRLRRYGVDHTWAWEIPPRGNRGIGADGA